MEANAMHGGSRDRGFSLVEILVVIVIIGVLATVVVFTVRGMADKGESSSCRTDGRTLEHAADYYIAQRGGADIAATGVGADRFERTLVDAGLINEVSTYYDLAADGSITTTGDPCT